MTGEPHIPHIPHIIVRNVSHEWETVAGPVRALDGVMLEIARGEVFCVVGPSGCGKSTLLQILAGLERPSGGDVFVAGKPVLGPGPDRGVVFQQYALFPWMTVRENVELGLKLGRVSREERRPIAERWIELVGLTPFKDRYPKELSGGMKQRTALARAWAVEPEVLLMDEPFGALDAQTRSTLQEELVRMLEARRTTVFFITHDVEEAVFLGARVGVMTARPGRIRSVVPVDLPAPRREELKLEARFVEAKRSVWELLRRETETR